MRKNIFIIISMLLIMIGLSAFTCHAQTVLVTGPYHVQEGSRIWIEGSTNITGFSCVSEDINGYGHLRGDTVKAITTSLAKDNDAPSVYVTLEDHSLDCGKRQMNRDMYHALKADKFPMIHYDLINAHVISTPDSTNGWFKVETRGRLTIAGKSKIINMIVDGQRLENDRFHVKGSKSLLMSDFNIKPPSPFWGLVKTHDKIQVKFNLYVAPENHDN